MPLRIISAIIGYVFGCLLTAEIVAKKFTGKSAREIGTTGNPGMANIMAHVGFKAGILVLIGDLVKTLIAMLVAWLIFKDQNGELALLYSGLGATLGHDFPVWRKFDGGKGVATTCMSVFVLSPIWGLLANISGMIVVFASQYLCVGAVVIPFVFAVAMYFEGRMEAAIVGLVLTLIMFIRHFPAIRLVPSGKCERVNVTGAIKKKFFTKKEKKIEEQGK